MKNIKMLMLVVSTLLVIVSCKSKPESEELYSGETGSIESSEALIDKTQLMKESDLIAKAQFIDKGEELITDIFDSNGEKIAISEVLIVTAEIVDGLKNPEKLQEIKVILPLGGLLVLDKPLKTYEEYVLCLEYNDVLEAYNIYSYSQGLFTLEKDGTIVSKIATFKYDEFATEVKSFSKE